MYLFIADPYASKIRIIDRTLNLIFTAAGNGSFFSGVDGQLASSTPVNGPFTVWGNTAGTIFLTEFLGNKVRTIQPTPVCPLFGYTFNINTNSCYKYVTSFVNWYTARDSCAKDDGAYLVTVDSEIEQKELELIDSMNQKWIGFYQYKNPPIDSNGTVNYRWIHDSTTSFSNWDIGQPDGDDPSGQNCIYISPTNGNKWNDESCVSNTSYYVCEYNLMPSASPTMIPSNSFTSFPTYIPTKYPTNFPSIIPSSLIPSKKPSVLISLLPTIVHTGIPSVFPSQVPTLVPSKRPTPFPIILSTFPQHTMSTVAGTGTLSSTGDGAQATSATIVHPFGIWQNSAGTIFIVEQGGHKVRALLSSGIISTFAGTGTASLDPTTSNGDNGPVLISKLNNYLSINSFCFLLLLGVFCYS
jgi:hypothetical protein